MLTGEPAVWAGHSKCKDPDAEEFLVGSRKNGTMTLEYFESEEEGQEMQLKGSRVALV